MYLSIFLVFTFFGCSHSWDYDGSWLDGFEEKDNFKHKALIVKLRKEPHECSTIAKKSDQAQWEECKKSL